MYIVLIPIFISHSCGKLIIWFFRNLNIFSHFNFFQTVEWIIVGVCLLKILIYYFLNIQFIWKRRWTNWKRLAQRYDIEIMIKIHTHTHNSFLYISGYKWLWTPVKLILEFLWATSHHILRKIYRLPKPENVLIIQSSK